MKQVRPYALCLIVVMLAMNVAGCSQAQLEKWKLLRVDTQAELDRVKVELGQERIRLEEARRIATSQPAGPERDKTLETIAMVEKVTVGLEDSGKSLNGVLKKIDAKVAAIEAGDASAFGQATGSLVGLIPGAGPWAGLIGIAAGTAFAAWQRSKRVKETEKKEVAQSDLKKVVYSLEVAGPDATKDEKAAIAAVQGPDTTARVHEIKTEIGMGGGAAPAPAK